MIIVAEKSVQKDCGTPISAVDTFSTIVKSTMKIAVESTITNGLYRFCAHKEPPRITGRTGNTQGAKTLSIHARKDINKRDMMTRSKKVEIRSEMNVVLTSI